MEISRLEVGKTKSISTEKVRTIIKNYCISKGVNMGKQGFSHESSKNKSVEWYTPRYIFEAIGITFDLDPCSPGKDVVPWIPAIKHLTVEDNGLMAEWNGNVWLNPPYGTNTSAWLSRLAMHKKGIALLFCRPDTNWFHKYVKSADLICLVKGRIQFVNEDFAEEYAKRKYKPKKSCGAASMLIAYGKENAKALKNSGLGLSLAVIE